MLDAKLMSDKIAKDVPKTDKPMPLPEPALVVGIKDAQAMRDAYLGYQEFFNKTLEVLRKFDEKGEIPAGYKIPWPEAAETPAGSTLRYTLPDEWGVDPQIVPNAVLTEKVAVVTASEAHSKRLLQGQAPAAGLLADGRRPRALAVVQLARPGRCRRSLGPPGCTPGRQENFHVEDDAPRSRTSSSRSIRSWMCLRPFGIARRNATSKTGPWSPTAMEISDVP